MADIVIPGYKDIMHKNILFPKFLSSLFTVQSTFSTSINEAENGFEMRKARRTLPIKKYNLSQCKIPKSDFCQLNNFFHNQLGQLYSFLLFDIHNFYVQDHPIKQFPSLNKNEFLLLQSYFQDENDYGYYNVQRVIKTPVINTIEIKYQGSTIPYEYDSSKGLVRLDDTDETVKSILSDNKESQIKATFKFYVPVRFSQDALSYSKCYNSEYIMIDSLSLKEVILV